MTETRSGLRPPDPPLDDGVVRLRMLRAADAVDVTRACADPEIRRWIPVMPDPYRQADAEGWIDAAPEDWEAGRAATFAIADAHDDQLLGAIGVHSFHRDRASVGYWVAPWARRRGVATRALRLASVWAIGELALVRLSLETLVGNEGSQVVAERAGFQREGVLRSYDDGRDGPIDVVMFSMLPTDLGDG